MFGLHMLNEMDKLNHEMNYLLTGRGLSPSLEKHTRTAGFRVEDVGDTFRIQGALPGIDVGKLEINVLGRQLSLLAELSETDVAENSTWHRRERVRSSIRKSFTLPEEIDSDKVEADYKNGILTILLPKSEKVLPKKITVKAG